MALSGIEAALRDLDASPSPAVARFDAGPEPAGRVAVLPSAFNPPTWAHLHLLDVGLAVEGVTSSAALLTTKNVAKEVFGAGLADRVAMLLAVQESRPGLAILATNVARLIDQAAALRAWSPRLDFDLVVGYDTLVRLFDSRYYADMQAELSPFFDRHRVIATNRGQHGVAAAAAFLLRPEARPFASAILVRELDDHPASLSSTAARSDVARGEHPSALPPEVAAYIRAHGLYAGD
jgi:nicotinamide-nucleotide adenylyltransferase